MLIALNNVSKSFGANEILTGITVTVENRDRVGLIGVNGAGKSTLLNIINGDLEADSGEVALQGGITLGFLRQNSGLDTGSTIIAELESCFAHIYALEAAMRKAECDMAALADHASPEASALAEEYDRLCDEYERLEGYQTQVKIGTVLNGMGFAAKARDTVIGTLSGGEKTRLALAKLLLEAPDILILDEPTNHLDFATLSWLEDYLTAYKGALILVSHDRYFLDKLVNHMWELENHRIEAYEGSYTKYRQQREERRERRQKEYDAQQEEVAKLSDYIARNLVRASTSKMAKSRRTQLEKMELLERPAAPQKRAKLSFTYEREPVKDVLHVNGLSLWVGQGESRKLLCDKLTLDVMRGNKVALIGANGIGKSSFLKEIQSGRQPEKIVSWGKNTDIAYYEQENTALLAQPNKTAIDVLWDRFPSLPEQSVRTALGQVLLTGESVFKRVSALSGGEGAKLKLAILLQLHANVLLLDEPTNHLDLATKEVLEQALTDYTGTLLFVSHDRYLLSRLPTHIVEMQEDGMVIYKGNYDDYVAQKAAMQSREQAVQDAIVSPAPVKDAATADKQYRTKKQRSEDAQQKRALATLENDIFALEERIAALEAELCSPEAAADYERLTVCCSEIAAAKSDLSALYERWEEYSAL